MEALRGELKRYPSSFSVSEDIKIVSERHLLQIKDKLLLELCTVPNEYSSSMERVRVWNLLSYLCFVLGDRENANKYNQTVSEESPNNIIALSNKAWFSFKDKRNLTICEKSLKRLKSLKSDTLAFLTAKAELAFMYSRLGLKLYANALIIFKEVMEEVDSCCKLNEQELSDKCTTYTAGKIQDSLVELKCVWTYGYAITLQRLLHVCNTSGEDSVEDITTRHRLVFELYESIVKINGDSECLLRYKARTLVQAGLLAYGVNKNRFLFNEGIKGLLPRHSAILMPTYRYFGDALKLFPNDTFVLERSGKYYRYVDDIAKSIRLLKTAVEVKGTSFGYHHLALSCIRLLEYNPIKLKHCLDAVSTECENSMNPFYQKPTEKPPAGKNVDVTELLALLKVDVDDPVANQMKQDDSRLVHDFKSHPDYSEQNKELNICQQQAVECSTRKCKNLTRSRSGFGKQSSLRPLAATFVPQKELKLGECCLSQTTNVSSKHEISIQSSDMSKFPTSFTFDERGYQRYYLGSLSNDAVSISDNTGKNAQQELSRNPRKYRRKFQSKSGFRKPRNQSTYHVDKAPRLQYMVKCLRYPKLIDHKKYKHVIDIIISHLDASTRISPNMTAVYDKAVFYRQIKQTDKALEVFESIMQNDGNLCSNILLANAYEQAAFCISDILDVNEKIDAEKKEQLMNDRQIYFKSSIEIACCIIDRHPYLGHCWRSAQTLRHILLCSSDVKRTKETLKDLWFLYEKMNNNEEAINVLQELKELTDDDADKRDIIEEIVKKYLCIQNYEEAVIALTMLVRLDEGRSSVDQNLYSRVYVESGLDAFRKRNYDKARLLIGKAYDKTVGVEEENLTIAENYDIFILSNVDDDGGQGRQLMLLLNNLGLNATFNSDSMQILPGTPEVEGLTKVMNMSRAFVILVNWDLDDKKMQHLVDRMRVIVEDRDEKSQIVNITNKEMHFPTTHCLSTYKTYVLDAENISESEIKSVKTYEGIKHLLIDLSSA